MDNRCTVPFDGYTQIFLEKGTVTSCCKIIHQPFEKSSSLLTQSTIELRQSIVKNERNIQCQSCWKIDDSGGPSLRRRASTHFAKTIDWDNLDIYQQPKKIEISFSNKCQLMCAYCGPNSSSMWQDNADKFIEWKFSTNQSNTSYKLSDLVNVDNLESIQITGGEPMLSDECIDFLMNLKFLPERSISIITNLSYGTNVFKKLQQIIEKHPNLIIYASIDSVGENITRKYLNWDLWDRNFCILTEDLQTRKKTYPNIYLMTKSTLGYLNYDKVQDVIEYVLQFRQSGYSGITFDINPLADNELTSLRSGKIDNNYQIILPNKIESLLSQRERDLINTTNHMIKNSKHNEQYGARTEKFLRVYTQT